MSKKGLDECNYLTGQIDKLKELKEIYVELIKGRDIEIKHTKTMLQLTLKELSDKENIEYGYQNGHIDVDEYNEMIKELKK